MLAGGTDAEKAPPPVIGTEKELLAFFRSEQMASGQAYSAVSGTFRACLEAGDPAENLEKSLEEWRQKADGRITRLKAIKISADSLGAEWRDRQVDSLVWQRDDWYEACRSLNSLPSTLSAWQSG